LSKLYGMFDGEIPFITPGDLDRSDGVCKRYVTKAGAAKSRIVDKGALLVCCIGTIGKMNKATQQSAFNQQINAVSWGSRVDADYALEMMRFFRANIARDGASTTLPILKKSRFAEILVPVPPISDQKVFANIVRAIESQRRQVNSHLIELNIFFTSLQSRAFAGEL